MKRQEGSRQRAEGCRPVPRGFSIPIGASAMWLSARPTDSSFASPSCFLLPRNMFRFIRAWSTRFLATVDCARSSIGAVDKFLHKRDRDAKSRNPSQLGSASARRCRTHDASKSTIANDF